MKWAMLWALLIFTLCAIPGKDLPHFSWLELLRFDKFVHASLFFIFILLLLKGIELQQHFTSAINYILAFTLSVLYGGALEILQGAFFADRSADIYDFIANTFGSILGIISYKKLKHNFLIRILFKEQSKNKL